MKALQSLQQRYGSGEGRALYELIMQHQFGLSRADILLGKDTTLSADDKAELQIIVDRVSKGEPVQYVLGGEEFCGREFLVCPDVLIPRPETQQLIQLVLQHLTPGSSVLDIGTGSGCIAVTLALAGYQVAAMDVSEKALEIARLNAKRLGAEVEFVKRDIIEDIIENEDNSSFDCIVSNPPYICEKEAAEMEENVLLHEPHIALFVPDDNPLLFYQAIADYGQLHLKNNGWLFFETNRTYTKQVSELLLQKGYKNVQTFKDQYDNERFACARKQ